MKVQKVIIYITALIVAVSFLLTIFTSIENSKNIIIKLTNSDVCSYLNSFAWTMLGSAFIAMITAVISYCAEKDDIEYRIFQDLLNIRNELSQYESFIRQDKEKAIRNKDRLIRVHRIITNSLMQNIRNYKFLFIDKKRFLSIYNTYSNIKSFSNCIQKDLLAIKNVENENFNLNLLDTTFENIEKQLYIDKSCLKQGVSFGKEFIVLYRLDDYLDYYLETILNKKNKDYKSLELKNSI